MEANRGRAFSVAWALMPRLTRWQWAELLDDLYEHDAWLWDHHHEELADAVAELADAVAREVWIASGMDVDDDDA
jgi:hypothetical protein